MKTLWNIRSANLNYNFFYSYIKRQFSVSILQKSARIKLSLAEQCFSPTNLLASWKQIKSNPSIIAPGVTDITLNKITKKWFYKVSRALLDGSFKYPTKRRISKPKYDTADKCFFTMINPRVKIIERAILNVLEPIFEGTWDWIFISKKEYKILKNNNLYLKGELKYNNQGHFKKNWHYRPIFNPRSYGFRNNRSVHGALAKIKHWKTSTAWFINYSVKKIFNSVNRNRLKNLFFKHVGDQRI